MVVSFHVQVVAGAMTCMLRDGLLFELVVFSVSLKVSNQACQDKRGGKHLYEYEYLYLTEAGSFYST